MFGFTWFNFIQACVKLGFEPDFFTVVGKST